MAKMKTSAAFRKKAAENKEKTPMARKRSVSQGAKEAMDGGIVKHRRPHRFRPGTRALMEIRKQQKSTKLLIARLPFERLVREIVQELTFASPSICSKSFEVLQEVAEEFILRLFTKSYKIAIIRKHTTLMPPDVQCAREIDTALH